MATNNNTTCGEDVPQTARRVEKFESFHIACICISVVIISINGTVIYLFLRNKNLRRCLSNIFLFSLAMSDLIFGAVALPTLIICELVLKDICQVTFFFQTATAFSSIYHLILGIAEKFFAICYTMKHRSRFTSSLAKKLSIFVWLMSLMIAHIPLWWWVIFRPDMVDALKTQSGFNVFQFVGVFAIPLVASAVMYALMLRAISKQFGQMVRIRSRQSSHRRKKVFLKDQRKCALVFAVMFTVFILCWTSWFVVTSFHLQPSMKVINATVISRYSAAIINPLLYTFIKKDFRRALMALFGQDDATQRGNRAKVNPPSGTTSHNEKVETKGCYVVVNSPDVSESNV